MAVTLHYRLTRQELWRWYWRAWVRPKGLWRFHILIFAAVTAGVALNLPQRRPIKASDFLVALAVGALATIFCVLWPQIRFKPQERAFTADEVGISTRIGRLSATIPWSKYASVETDEDFLVITRKNGNAFAIPDRAFKDDSEKAEAVRLIREWLYAPSSK